MITLRLATSLVHIKTALDGYSVGVFPKQT